ncbi:MAG: arginine repressor [Planctomycetota bacterium]
MKTRRHATIRTLIAAGEIRSQQELGQRLAREGIEVTQATLSRDLAEIGVLKGPDGYQLPGAAPAPANEETLARVLRRELLSATAGGTLVVLKTLPGHGNALAIELDRASTAGTIKGVLGSIAGDDTIFLAASSDLAARRLAKELRGAAQLV